MKLWLHIGTKKTGTTSLQHFLRGNETLLKKQGVVLPNSFGTIEARTLTQIFRKPGKPDLSAPAWALFCKAIEEAGAAGMESAVLSAESLVDLGRRQVAALAARLGGMFSSIQIILYIRRQDRVAVSHYSTALRGGGVPEKSFSDRLGTTQRAMLYGTLMTDWERAFGRKALVIRRFAPQFLVDGDVIADFCSVIGVDHTRLSTLPRENEALPGSSAVFLRFLNKLDREHDHVLRPVRARIVQALERSDNYGIGLPKPSRAEMAAFLQTFDAQNELVRRRYFPEEASLFDSDFSMYPDIVEKPVQTLSFEQAMELAYSCLVALAALARPGEIAHRRQDQSKSGR